MSLKKLLRSWLEKLIEKLFAPDDCGTAQDVLTPAAVPASPEKEQTAVPAGPEKETPAKDGGRDAVPFKDLDFCWGDFKGAGASICGGRIADLKIGSKLSYRTTATWWKELGCSSKTDAHAVACLFCRLGGKWTGGKMDWLSESRTTRDFKNVESGYKGWRTDAVKAADGYAFVVVSEDGKRRTNVITAD